MNIIAINSSWCFWNFISCRAIVIILKQYIVFIRVITFKFTAIYIVSKSSLSPFKRHNDNDNNKIVFWTNFEERSFKGYNCYNINILRIITEQLAGIFFISKPRKLICLIFIESEIKLFFRMKKMLFIINCRSFRPFKKINSNFGDKSLCSI